MMNHTDGEEDEAHICTECISDDNFSQWIAMHGKEGKCSFDKSHGNKNKVISVEEFAEYVDEYFRSNYGFGEEYVYAINDSDKRQYATRGNTYHEILSNDLMCDGDTLDAIIEAFPDNDYAEIRDGGESFYDECANYESLEDVEKRNQQDIEDYYYEIETSLSNIDPIETLHNSLESMERLLKEKDLMDESLHRFQLMMIFGFCITSLESYLYHIFTEKVLTNEILKIKYIEYDTRVKGFKKTACELYLAKDELEKIMEEVDNHIKSTLQNITFHNIKQTKKLYKNVLEINLDNFEQFGDFVKKRHSFVHLGGKSKDGGSEIKTSKEEIEDLIGKIKKFCDSLDKKVDGMEDNLPF